MRLQAVWWTPRLIASNQGIRTRSERWEDVLEIRTFNVDGMNPTPGIGAIEETHRHNLKSSMR